jgi:uncharacterized protein DUF6335
MAKRKAAGRTKKASKTGAVRRAKPGAKRSAAKKTAARKKTAKTSRAGARKAVARKSRARAAGKARTAAKGKVRGIRRAGVRKAGGDPNSAGKPFLSGKTAVARKAPALDRQRRTMQGDDIVPTPPSSLDLDRTASAARSGRRHVHDRLNEYHETSPALTAGDVDADWESAASVGDEAPGGDNPTPDQDVVDDIGRAVGVQYDDNEELKGEAKISKRDKHRWELDPASSEDFNDR